jgi:hypothetical protein
VVLLCFTVFTVVCVVSLSMKTKSRAVRRPHGEPMLEDGGSVNATLDGGSTSHLLPYVDLGSVSCPTDTNVPESCIDVDASGTYGHGIFERVVNEVDVVATSIYSRNNISINERHSYRRHVLNASVIGKGKRKIDDLPVCVGEGMFTTSIVVL